MVEPVEVWNQLIARSGDPSSKSLSEDERAILLTNVLLIETENGGISGLLYNLSPVDRASWSELRRTAAAVSRVCVHGIGESLSELADILEKAPQSNITETWGRFLAHVSNDHFTNLTSRIEVHVGDLWEELEDFTILHSF